MYVCINTLPALGVVTLGNLHWWSCSLVALAHILHAQIATCTVMVVHGSGSYSGVMEVVPWDSSMWWLYINIIFGHVTL